MQDFDFIETPEHVELERRLAGIGSRFIAGLLDCLLVAAALLVLWLMLQAVGGASILADLAGSRSGRAAANVMIAVMIALGFLLIWGYFVFFELRTNGQSPGKMQQRIRVVKAGGGPITFTDVAIRNLLRIVDFLPGFYGLAGLVMFFSRKVQRLGDLAAGTVVVSEVPPNYAATARQSKRTAGAEWQAALSPEALRASGLTPQEYTALASYWERRHQLTLEARRRVLPQLVGPILQRTGRTLPNQTLAMLEAYVHEQLHSAREARPAGGAPAPAAQEDRP